jgi:N-acylethanolamine-hydrolysing acid amidase
MSLKIFLITVLVVGAFCRINITYNNIPETFRPPKTFKIDLDLPPVERWREFVTANLEGIKAFETYFLNQYKIPSFAFSILGYLAEFHPDKEFLEEISAITELSQLSKGMIFAVNYMYDISAFCTSIVFRGSDGKVHHGRNLDYSFRELIGNITANGEFYQGGKLIHKVL